MSKRKVTLEEFARRVNTSNFEWALNLYREFLTSGLSLGKWIAENSFTSPISYKRQRNH